MTRRFIFALPAVLYSRISNGSPYRTNADSGSDGFIVRGELQAENEPGFYAINGAETVALMLSPEQAPAMVKAADALLKQQVELVLRRKL